MGIQSKCGTDFPILIKINNDTATNNDAYEQDMIYMLKELKQLSVEVVELSGYDFLGQPKTARNYYLARVARLKKVVDIPMSLVGGIRSLTDVEAVLATGIELVSLGRPLISEPDFFNKMVLQDVQSRCISCNRCFVLPQLKYGIRCVFNRKK